ncbi:MAG: amidase family protein [Rhodospirillaceae bacterium]|nr:amidase family protein [Rhodospirillaceae bacterium]MDD9996752.1 amidase family protein [Rhodospirillaceae bacterium]
MRSSTPLRCTILSVLVSAIGCEIEIERGPPAVPEPYDVIEATIPELQAAMEEGRLTSHDLVQQYLMRIAVYENLLNATITVNPNALAEAERLDRERVESGARGPLHGIPIALKDNIHTTDMPTTGGALAFERLIPPYDATLTEQLRDAGAVIIAKTVMTELANWVAGAPYDMPDNYSSLGGYSFNPYDPRRDPRPGIGDGMPVLSPGGSSSGIGTGANLWAANVGTETSGSILWPSNQNMLVGIKPTLGRVSRHGIIPITADQDTAGPMARTVTDAAILLGAIESSERDPNDPATGRCEAPPNGDYTAFLDADSLQGARIGVPRAGFVEPVAVPGQGNLRGGLNQVQAELFEEAIAVLEAQGAIVVDPADLPTVVDTDPDRNLFNWGICAAESATRGNDAHCSIVFKYGMKRDFNAWLASLGDSAPLRSLAELREWNREHALLGTVKYEQSLLDISDDIDLNRDRARYEADRAKDIELTAAHGIDAAISENDLDALLFPMNRGANVSARPGYPTVIVPLGVAPYEAEPPFSEGFAPKPAPFGVSFTGLACSEPRLIELAYAFEQATMRRVPPPSAP